MFALIWMFALPMSMMSVHSGVLLWVWVALLSPNELLYGFMAGVPFNKLVAVVTLGLVVFSQEKKDFYLDAILALLLAFLGVATASWLTSIVPSDDGDNLYQKLLKVIVLAFVITTVMTSRLRQHLLVLAVVLSFAFLSVKEGLIAVLTAGGHKIVGTGGIGDNNSLATALLMAIPLNFYLTRYSAVRWMRLGLFAVLILSVITVIMTYSRGGFVGLLVVAAFMVKNSRNKFGSIIMVLLGGVLIYTLAPSSWFERLNTIETADNDGSFMGRVVAWKISWLIALAYPFFGGGMHAVQRLPVWDRFRPYLPSLDFITTPPADVSPHAAHSIYFEVLGDLGFIGLGTFLLLLAVVFFKLWRIKRLARRRPSLQWAGDLAGMLQISFVVYAVTGAALSMAYFELVYVLLALVSRCSRTVQQTLATEDDAQIGPIVPAPRGKFVPGPLVQPKPQPVMARSGAPAVGWGSPSSSGR